MKLNTEKITRCLLEIRARRLDLGKLLDDHLGRRKADFARPARR
jgi:hypothetical protein